MILTRYKGVDVTPHTFNNLIKTITNQKSISNNSTSKTEFEDRIREIILAFNPMLKKNGAYMTTEYMLVNTLKGADKKEVTHTYNYNNWGENGGGSNNNNNNDDVTTMETDVNCIDVEEVNKKLKLVAVGEWNDDKMEQLLDVVYSVNEPCVRKINKKYTKYVDGLKRKHKQRDENGGNDALASIKGVLSVIKLDNNQLVVLCDTIKGFVTKHNDNNTEYDTIEKYVYAFRVLGEKIDRLQQEVETSKEEKCKQQTMDEIQTNTLATIEAQTRKIKTLTDQCERFNNTITQNVIEIAKLGGEAGEKDVLIEELQNELQQSRIQVMEMKQFEEMVHELNCGVEMLRGKNTKLDEHNDELLKLNSKLESQVQQLQEQLKQKEEDLNVCNQSFYKILNKREEDDEDKQRKYIVTIQSLTNERDMLLQEKQLLQKSVDEYKEFQVNIQIRMQQLETECAIKNNELNYKEQALNLCINKVEDQNEEYLRKLEEITRLTCKIQNVQKEYNTVVEECDTIRSKLDSVTDKLNKCTQKNEVLLKDNEKYYEEGDVVIKENVVLKCKIKKLQNDVERLEEHVKKTEAECDNKIKCEQNKFDEFKEELVKLTKDKWLQDKQILIDKYEKMLKGSSSSSDNSTNNEVVNIENTPTTSVSNRKRGKSDLKNVPLKLAKTVMSVKPISRKENK